MEGSPLSSNPGTAPGVPSQAAASELIEYVAAAFHTLTRAWYYDPEAALKTNATGMPAMLEPWVETTEDPSWLAREQTSVDLANTWWENLPADWRERFLDIGAAAASAVVTEIEAGCSVAELAEDEDFIAKLSAELTRPWLAPPRVIIGGNVSGEPRAAERALARTAVHVYAARVAGFGGLGTIPPFPPPDFSDPDRFIRLDASGSLDAKHVSFRISGDDLDPDRLTRLTGLQPTTAYRKGDLRIRRQTGQLGGPYQTGMWLISTEEHVEKVGPTLEDHINWLLDRLEPHATELTTVMAELHLEADFFCGYWQRQWNSAWELSARTVRLIATLEASLAYDAYVDYEDGEDAEDA